MDQKEIISRLKPYLISDGLIKEDTVVDELWMGKVIASLKERCRTLIEFTSAARYFFSEDLETDPEAAKKFLIPENRGVIEDVLKGMESITSLSETDIDGLFKAIMSNKGLKMGQVAQPVRVALTGRAVSPGIFEVIDILGKDKVVRRLRTAIDKIPH